MVGHHEGLGRELAGAVARRDQRVDLLGVQRDRLLGQDVLAGLERLRVHSTWALFGSGM